MPTLPDADIRRQAVSQALSAAGGERPDGAEVRAIVPLAASLRQVFVAVGWQVSGFLTLLMRLVFPDFRRHR
jgi:hypothetical protein